MKKYQFKNQIVIKLTNLILIGLLMSITSIMGLNYSSLLTSNALRSKAHEHMELFTKMSIDNISKSKSSSLRASDIRPVTSKMDSIAFLLDSIVNKDANGVLINKQELTYDSNDNLTQYFHFTWNSTKKEWIGDWKYEYYYNNNGQQTLIIYYYWDSTSKSWIQSSKYEFSYDSNGNEILETDYEWNSTSKTWIVAQKEELTWDGNGNQRLRTVYQWDSIYKVWIENKKSEYTYDSNGQLTLSTFFTWESAKKTWIAEQKVELTNNGLLTLEIYYNWDSTNKMWVEFLKYEFSYDSNGNQILETAYRWNTTNKVWIGLGKVEFFYDSNGNITQRSNYYSDNTLSSIAIYYYSQLEINAVINPFTLNLNISPNPVKDILHINGLTEKATISIYNFNGEQLLNKEINLNEAISVNNLSQGVYLVNVKTRKGAKKSMKLIKE